jgi:hypothetical protein
MKERHRDIASLMPAEGKNGVTSKLLTFAAETQATTPRQLKNSAMGSIGLMWAQKILKAARIGTANISTSDESGWRRGYSSRQR